MATLSVTERLRLGLVRPELQQLLLELKDAALAQYGYVVVVAVDGGTRSIAKQAALYADSLKQGDGTLAYPVATPGHSRHNYGAAFDGDIVSGGSAADGTGTDDDYRTLATLAESLTTAPGLTAGYFFEERGLAQKDPYHFQLKESLATSQQLWTPIVQHAGTTAVAIVAFVAIGLVAAARSSWT